MVLQLILSLIEQAEKIEIEMQSVAEDVKSTEQQPAPRKEFPCMGDIMEYIALTGMSERVISELRNHIPLPLKYAVHIISLQLTGQCR